MYCEGTTGKLDFKREDLPKLIEFVQFLLSVNCEVRIWNDDVSYVVEYLDTFAQEDGKEFLLAEEFDDEQVD